MIGGKGENMEVNYSEQVKESMKDIIFMYTGDLLRSLEYEDDNIDHEYLQDYCPDSLIQFVSEWVDQNIDPISKEDLEKEEEE